MESKGGLTVQPPKSKEKERDKDSKSKDRAKEKEKDRNKDKELPKMSQEEALYLVKKILMKEGSEEPMNVAHLDQLFTQKTGKNFKKSTGLKLVKTLRENTNEFVVLEHPKESFQIMLNINNNGSDNNSPSTSPDLKKIINRSKSVGNVSKKHQDSLKDVNSRRSNTIEGHPSNFSPKRERDKEQEKEKDSKDRSKDKERESKDRDREREKDKDKSQKEASIPLEEFMKEFTTTSSGRSTMKRQKLASSSLKVDFSAWNMSLNSDFDPDAKWQALLKNIQPSQEMIDQYGNILDRISMFLKEYTPFNIKEFVKGGAFGKGTMLCDSADIDIVVFFNKFTFSQQQKCLPSLIKLVQSLLSSQEMVEITDFNATPYSLKFVANGVAFDLYPATGELNMSNLPEQITRASKKIRQYYGSLFLKQQVEFVKGQDNKVKDLIRLGKFWKKCYKETSPPSTSIPKSYLIELMVIHLASKGIGSIDSFIDNFLSTIVDYRSLNTSFENYFKLSIVDPKLLKDRPLLLDPTNPTNNIAEEIKDWKPLVEFAKRGKSVFFKEKK